MTDVLMAWCFLGMLLLGACMGIACAAAGDWQEWRGWTTLMIVAWIAIGMIAGKRRG